MFPKGVESQGEEEGIEGAWPRAAGRKTHHAVSSQEVWDHVFVHVVYQPSWALVVIATVNEELLPCVLIDKGTDLKESVDRRHNCHGVKLETVLIPPHMDALGLGQDHNPAAAQSSATPPQRRG